MNASMQSTTATQLPPAKIQMVALHVLVIKDTPVTESIVKVSHDITSIGFDSIGRLLLQKVQVDELHNCYLPLILNDEGETQLFFPKKVIIHSM